MYCAKITIALYIDPISPDSSMATEEKSSKHKLHGSDIDIESQIERKHKLVDPIQHELKKQAYDDSSSIIKQQEMISSLNLQLTEKNKMIEQLEEQLNMIVKEVTF